MERLFDAFGKSGRQLYLVGGAVRDLLMGAEHRDLDDLDFGADIGAGIEVDRFLLEFRYSFAFTDAWSRGGIEILNEAYGLMLGFAIR